MSIRCAPSLLPSPGQARVPKHELEYIPFSIASKTFVRAPLNGATPVLNDDAKVPHLGESAFQDQYSTINTVPEVYLNTDLSSAPQHSIQRRDSLTLEQAFDYTDPFGANAAQEQYQSWPQRQSIIQELPFPRASQTRKRKMTGSGLNERYARMTADMSILVQWPWTIAIPTTDVFVQPEPMMEHTNTYYGSADLVEEISSPTQATPIQAYSQLRPIELLGQFRQAALTTIQSSSITSNTTTPYAPQRTVSQQSMDPSKMGGAYSTPHFRFSPPGGRMVESVDSPRTQHTPATRADCDVQESSQTVPVDQNVRRTFQPHVHFEDISSSPRAKAVVGSSAQPLAKRPRKENKLPFTPSLTSITPPPPSLTIQSPTMSTAATAISANDAPGWPHFELSEMIKSMGQKMRASASAAVALPSLLNGSSALVLPGHGSSRASQTRVSQTRVSHDLDSALMPPPKYLPKRVARSQAVSEGQTKDENELMMYGGQVPDANVADTGDNVAIDAQDEAGVRLHATEELDEAMSLERELHGLID